MRLTNMSIKYRLLLLCLIPTIVIISLSTKLVRNIQEQVVSYEAMEIKHTTLHVLNEFSQHFFLLLEKRLQASNQQTALLLAKQSLSSLQQVLIAHPKQSGSHTRSMSYIHELEDLLQDVEHAELEDVVDIGRLTHTIIYDFYVDIHSADLESGNRELDKLDKVIGDLSWLYYWMQQEAWLAHEIQILDRPYSNYAADYFRINERQQIYMDTFISSGADSQQVEILLTLFSSREIQQGAYLKEKMLRRENNSVDMREFVSTIGKRNKLVKQQLMQFQSDLQAQLSQNMSNRRLELWLIGCAALTLFSLIAAWGEVQSFGSIQSSLKFSL